MKHEKIGNTKLVITGVFLFILLSGIGLVAASNDAVNSNDEKSPLFTYRTDSVAGNPTNVKVDYVAKETPSVGADGQAGGSGGQMASIPITEGSICTFLGWCSEPLSDSWEYPSGCIGPRDPNRPPSGPVRTEGCSTNEVECDTFGEINCPSE
jgi:hypothetical protein